MEKKLRTWLESNLGKRCLAPLTGQDWKALLASVAIIELYSYDRTDSVLEALRIVVQQMQPQCQRFAYHAIAMVLEWEDRDTVWALIGLPKPENAGRCEFEPR